MFWKKKVVKEPEEAELIVRLTDGARYSYSYAGKPLFSDKALRPFVHWYFGRLQSSKHVLHTVTGVDVLERDKIAHVSLKRVVKK